MAYIAEQFYSDGLRLLQHEALTLEEARRLVAKGFELAIGHQETAVVLSELLNTPVPANCIEYIQHLGDKAIFKLKSRIPAGAVLNRQEIEAIGYEFGLLTRTK
jgi:STIV B116-like